MGNRTMQIDAFRDQLEVLEGDAIDPAGLGTPSLPPPLPPRSSVAPTSMAPPDASPQGRGVLIGVSLFVAVLAVGAALWVASLLTSEPEPSTAPALEIGPIEIDLSTPAEE